MVRLTDRLNMMIAVDWDIKPQTKQTEFGKTAIRAITINIWML